MISTNQTLQDGLDALLVGSKVLREQSNMNTTTIEFGRHGVKVKSQVTGEQSAYTCNGARFCKGDEHDGCLHCDAKAIRAVRSLADWMQINRVRRHEIVAVRYDGSGPNVHLTLRAGTRLWPGKSVTFVEGFARFMDGSIEVIVQDDRKPEIESTLTL